LHILIVDGLALHFVSVWHVDGLMHPLRNSHIPHLILNSQLIPFVLLLLPLLLHIFFGLFLVDLKLESCFDLVLLLFTLVCHDLLLIPALPQDVSVPLKLQIYSILNSTSRLHIREVLLGDGSIELRPAVSCLVGHGLCLRVHVESLVVRVEGLHLLRLHIVLLETILKLLSGWLLCVLGRGRNCIRDEVLTWSHEASSFGLPPVVLLSQEISFFDLPFKFICETFLLYFFLN